LGAVVVLQGTRWVAPPALPSGRTAVLVQVNIPILDVADWTSEYFQDTLRDLNSMSFDAASQKPSRPSPEVRSNLIVWPESPAPFSDGDPVFRNAVSNLARESQAWVLTGDIGASPAGQSSRQMYNSASLVSPSGEWTARYDKVHLVPFGEYTPFPRLFSFAGGLTKEVGAFTAGQAHVPLDAGGARLGVFICYESIFPDEVRQLAASGAQVLVNISNDAWYGDSGAYAQHSRQTRMRAIENNRWLLNDTNTGLTAAIDPDGRIVATVPRKLRTVLQAPYALSDVTTFYTRHGDWFAYLCAIISVVALLSRLFRRTRSL
jgi:apolipoprotein N-acyltransferase